MDEALARLEPWAHRVSFEGIGAGLYGSAARSVAIGCSAVGRHDDAVRHAEAAVTINRNLGGLLLADALRTLADVIEGRDGESTRSRSLHAEADEANAALGLDRLVRRDATAAPPAAPAPPATAPINEMRRAGEVWHVSYAGTEIVLRRSTGLADLAVLLARPGTDVHVGELEGVPRPLTESSGGDALDRRAIAAYRDRLGELAGARRLRSRTRPRQGRTSAPGVRRPRRAAVRLGRSRWAQPRRRAGPRRTPPQGRLGPPARRHPPHRRRPPCPRPPLSNAVHTGVYCVYRPELPTVWRCQS